MVGTPKECCPYRAGSTSAYGRTVYWYSPPSSSYDTCDGKNPDICSAVEGICGQACTSADNDCCNFWYDKGVINEHKNDCCNVANWKAIHTDVCDPCQEDWSKLSDEQITACCKQSAYLYSETCCTRRCGSLSASYGFSSEDCCMCAYSHKQLSQAAGNACCNNFPNFKNSPSICSCSTSYGHDKVSWSINDTGRGDSVDHDQLSYTVTFQPTNGTNHDWGTAKVTMNCYSGSMHGNNKYMFSTTYTIYFKSSTTNIHENLYIRSSGPGTANFCVLSSCEVSGDGQTVSSCSGTITKKENNDHSSTTCTYVGNK